MVDAADSKSAGGNPVGVRYPSPAPLFYQLKILNLSIYAQEF